MRKLRKSIIALGLSAVTLFSSFTFIGCSKEIKDVEFWSCHATDKILRDQPDLYTAEQKGPAEINLKVIGGEVESSQIIMTTGDKAVESYDVTLTDLTSGDDTISKDNVTVYHEKYLYMSASEYYKVTGEYPDCLAPFEGVKAVNENNVKANSNQGLYVSFKIPEDQAAGIYKGTMTITIDGKEKEIPITVTVVPVAIGKETHTKSSFSVNGTHERGELDSTQEMMDAYVDFLAEYRLGPARLLADNGYTDAEIQLEAQKACEYVQREDAVSYGIKTPRKTYDEYTVGDQTYYDIENIYDIDYIVKYFVTFYKEGLKQGVNPFEKMFFRGLDEPHINGTVGAVPVCSAVVMDGKEASIEEILKDELTDAADIELRDKMIESIKKVPHVVTVAAAYTDIDAETMDFTYCPLFNVLNSEEGQGAFRIKEDSELWWYGCNTPSAPYPTYHMDNTLVSPRVLSWMQADYDVVGNLYWGADTYTMPNNDGSNYLEDYYEGGAIRSARTAGEGYLTYAGKKYGVDGPIPSLRLEAIRDGLEEYEMIYRLHQLYTAKGYDEDYIMNLLYQTMYLGTRVNTDVTADIFQTARDRLIDLLVLAESDANLMVTNVVENRGKTVYTVYANSGYTPTFSSKFSVTEKVVDGGKLYTVTCAGEEMTFDLSVGVDGNTYAVSFDKVGGVSNLKDAAYFNANGSLVKDTVTNAVDFSFSMTDSLAAGDAITKYARLNFGASTTVKQSFLIEDDVVTSLNKSNRKVTFEFYYDSDVAREISVYYIDKKNGDVSAKLDTVTLKRGVNELTFEGINLLTWSNIGGIAQFLIEVGQVGDAAFSDLYFVCMSVA